MKFASFDLEIAGELEQVDESDLGISAAAVICDGDAEPTYFYREPRLTEFEAGLIVRHLLEYRDNGFVPLTWNGCGFDFKVLSDESGLVRECADLALNHVDLMLLVTFQKGHYLGLDRALSGMGLQTKLHSVTLKDGSILNEMNGALAPQLWRAGETEAVLTYLEGDVRQPLELAHTIERLKCLNWITKSGRQATVSIPALLTVKEALTLYPKPDTSWMSQAPTREQFFQWVPEEIREELLR